MDTQFRPADLMDRDRLVANLKQLVDEADQLLHSARHGGAEPFGTARTGFDSRLRHARAEWADLQDHAGYRVRRVARRTDLAAHDHPYAAMGMAAGIGVLLGMLIRHR